MQKHYKIIIRNPNTWKKQEGGQFTKEQLDYIVQVIKYARDTKNKHRLLRKINKGTYTRLINHLSIQNTRQDTIIITPLLYQLLNDIVNFYEAYFLYQKKEMTKICDTMFKFLHYDKTIDL